MRFTQVRLHFSLLFMFLAAPVISAAAPISTSRFLVFDGNLALVEAFDVSESDGRFGRFDVLPNDDLVVLSSVALPAVHVYTPSGQLVDTFGESLLQATAVAVVRGSFLPQILVADGATDSIRVYAHDGTEVGQIVNPLLNFPTLLTFDEATNALITDINFLPSGLGPDLVRMDLDGNILARNASATIFGRPGGGIVDVTPSGRGTFFVTSTLNTEIAEIDQDLQLLRRFDSGSESGALRTLGLAVSPDGSTFVVADGDGQSGHGFMRVFNSSTGLQISQVAHPALQFPIDLGFDSRGFLFVADRGWIAQPVPEPSHLVLITLGLFAALRRHAFFRRP